jgi:uncharacterized membrane protein
MEKTINTEAEVKEAEVKEEVKEMSEDTEVTEEETLKVLDIAENVITVAVGVALISDIYQDIRLLFVSGGCMIIAGIIVLLHSRKLN